MVWTEMVRWVQAISSRTKAALVSARARAQAQKGDILGVALLILASWKFTLGLEQVVDIDMWDETYYLFRGVQIPQVGLPPADWAPLYSLWYYLLSLFEPDRVHLYYLNYKLLAIIPTVLLYVLLRRYRVALPVSLAVALCFLISRLNVSVMARLALFALSLILVTLILARGQDNMVRRLVYLSLGGLVVSYARPEFFLAPLVFVGLLGVVLIRCRLARQPAPWRHLLAPLAAAALLIGVLGLPVTTARAMDNFGPSFTVQWAFWTGNTLHHLPNWPAVVNQYFGPVRTVPQAIVANPGAYLWYLSANLYYGWTKPPVLLRPAADYPPVWSALLALALAAVLIHQSVAAQWRHPAAPSLALRSGSVAGAWRHRLQRLSDVAIFVPFIVPGLLACVITFPREHLLSHSLTLSMALLTVMTLSSTSRQASKQSGLRDALACGVLVLLMTLFSFADNWPATWTALRRDGIEISMGDHWPHTWTDWVEGRQDATFMPDWQQESLKTVRVLQSLRIRQPVTMLAMGQGYEVYVGALMHHAGRRASDMRFDEFLTAHGVNLIVISDPLMYDLMYANDPEWHAFLADYRGRGFTQIEVPNTTRKLIVRNDLLSN